MAGQNIVKLEVLTVGYLVIIQHCVEVLDPDGIHRAIQDNPGVLILVLGSPAEGKRHTDRSCSGDMADAQLTAQPESLFWPGTAPDVCWSTLL